MEYPSCCCNDKVRHKPENYPNSLSMQSILSIRMTADVAKHLNHDFYMIFMITLILLCGYNPVNQINPKNQGSDNLIEFGKLKPVIKAQELIVESAEKTLNIANSGYLPSLNLTSGYGTNYFT